MKKAVFHSMMAMVLVLGFTLAMATPGVAQVPPIVGVEKDTIPGTGHPDGVYLIYQEVVYSLLVANDTGEAMTVNWIRDRFAAGSDAVEDAYWNREDEEWVHENPNLPFGIDAEDSWVGSVAHTIRPEHLIDDPDNFPGTKVVRNQIMFDAMVQGENYDDFFPRTVRVIQPAIELTKTVPAEPVPAGQTVTYTFTITNTGDWGLENITLHDDVLGILTGYLPSLALPVGESMSFEYTHPIEDQPVENTATVEAVAEGFSPTEFPYSDPEDEQPTAVVRDTASATVTPEPHPVGGTASPVSRLALLAPWIVLAGVIAGAAVFVWSRRAQGRA